MSHSIQDFRRHWLDRQGFWALLITACFAFTAQGALAADKDKDKPKGN
ncbi:MAG: hypothetical protein QOF42_2735, partial [Gammaproteobacteria bacterium]|nr:hypothetical protein [Gammaproteobacteria bacterium]